jgi:hypothetical protein
VRAARRLSGELGVHAPWGELRESHRTTFPLLPQKRPKPSPCPVVQLSQPIRGLAEAEIALPTAKIAAEFVCHCLHTYPARPSRQLPDSFLEAENRFGRYAPLRFTMQGKTESQKLPLPWSRHRALGLVDLEFELRSDAFCDAGHHSFAGTPAANVNIAIVRMNLHHRLLDESIQHRRDAKLLRPAVRLREESPLEEAHIKLSSLLSDLLGASARRMLKALADGETNPAALAALADKQLRATPEQLCDALGACLELNPVYCRRLKMALEQLQFLEQQIGDLDQETASLLRQHQDAVERLAEVPGLGVDSATQIIAEVGPMAATLSFGEASLLVGGRLPGRRTKRRRELQPSIPTGQPPHAAPTQSGRECRREGQRKYLRNCLSALGAAPRT